MLWYWFKPLCAPPWSLSARKGYLASRERLRKRRKTVEEHRDVKEVVAVAQLSAWRDAWRAGASFITLDLVARHIQRPVEWVKDHWNDVPPSGGGGPGDPDPDYQVPNQDHDCSRDSGPCCHSPCINDDDSCCSWDESQLLWHIWYAQLASLVPVLDPALHTCPA